MERVFRRFQTWGAIEEGKVLLSLINHAWNEYPGHVGDAEGVYATPAKVEAITAARNVQELSLFLGLVSCYSKFIHHMSTLTQPLNCLLCKNTR